MLRHLSLVSLLVLPLAARGATPDAFQTHLSAAAMLHESLEFDQALAALEKAKRLVRDTSDEVTVALWRGVVLAEQKKHAEADAAFREGLSLDLEARLPTAASPKIVQEFEAVRAALRKVLPPKPALPKPLPTPPMLEAEKPFNARPLAAVLGSAAVLSGATSLVFGLLVEPQVQRAKQATYQTDALAPVQSASTFATTSLATGIAAGVLFTTALVLWLVSR